MGREKFGMGREGINPDGEGKGLGLKIDPVGMDPFYNSVVFYRGRYYLFIIACRKRLHS